ncbi:unnamed protein product [Rotaria sordida]|uniref:Uncharacterized protein n=1 Tax=Rotaria sordida TaxID=392033 RepID=A0A815QY48_9BILA|nr:unnamed protein product [Rotaria sordida]
MWLHEKFYDAEKLLKYNSNWVLYTISDRYAYFTLLPKPITEYNVKNAPFLWVEQFTDALKLARMPIKDFCTFACHSLGPMKGKSTEGDIPRDCDFMWLHEKFYDAEKLLKYNPNWVLYTISDRYAYFTLLPKPIAEYNVRNAPFLFLKQFTDALKLARMPIKDFCTFACHSLGPMKGKLLKYNPNWILYTITDRYAYFTLLPKPLTEYNVKNTPFLWLEQFTNALKLARMPIKDFCTFACHSLGPMKGKENLISKPEETIGAVFDVCGISKSLIPEAVTALNRDSQAGTVLSRDKMAQVKSPELSKFDRKRLNEIAKRMELPESVFHF